MCVDFNAYMVDGLKPVNIYIIDFFTVIVWKYQYNLYLIYAIQFLFKNVYMKLNG